MESLFNTLVNESATQHMNVEGINANLLPDVDYNDFEQLWFTNRVNHFDQNDERTYQERYWVNDQYWDGGDAPNFIYLCGEYTCSPPDDRHFPFMVGAHFGARLFVIEHRYYGYSQPMPDWSVESYQYLNAEQALADFAQFLAAQNEDNVTRPTVVIGGSYPGAMSAWFRDKYPQWAVASWAASAVVQPLEDMWTYDEQVYLSLQNIGQWCADILVNTNIYATEQGILRNQGMANDIDQYLVGTPAEGMSTDDFLSYYGDFPAGAVQYGGSLGFCDNLKEIRNRSVSEQFNSMMAGAIEGGDVPADYDTRGDAKINSIEIDGEYSGRSWTWQYCTEFGFFQTPSKLHRVRSQFVDNEYWRNQCQIVFGEDFNMANFPKIKRTEIEFGGNHIQGSNIFFTNGWEDPWKWVTQMENRPEINQLSRVSDCVGCAHCADLYTPAKSDPEDLKTTRQTVFDWVSDILADHQAAVRPSYLQ